MSIFAGVEDGKGSTLFLSTLKVNVESIASFVSEHDAKVNTQIRATINPRAVDMRYSSFRSTINDGMKSAVPSQRRMLCNSTFIVPFPCFIVFMGFYVPKNHDKEPPRATSLKRTSLGIQQ